MTASRAVGEPVDAVDRADDAHAAPVGARDLDRRVRAPRAAERELGRDRVGAVLGAVVAVEVEERVELRVQLAAGARPQQPPAAEPARLDVVARLAQDLVQPRAVLGRPRPADAGLAAQLGEERVERGVHDVALVERRELDELLGPLDRPARAAGSCTKYACGHFTHVSSRVADTATSGAVGLCVGERGRRGARGCRRSG